jgi:hypothetical protein
MVKFWETVQYLRQVGGAELCSSTASGDLARQSNLFITHQTLHLLLNYFPLVRRASEDLA